jgi:hypothetical protein
MRDTRYAYRTLERKPHGKPLTSMTRRWISIKIVLTEKGCYLNRTKLGSESYLLTDLVLTMFQHSVSIITELTGTVLGCSDLKLLLNITNGVSILV